jgi:alpha-tubulin suppressor-like RCC1 family protein
MKMNDESSAGVGEIEIGSDITITKIVGGKHHMLALDQNGRVWSWGKNDKG